MMSKVSLTPQQQAKLDEALEVAKLAEEKAKQISELSAHIVDKYQQHLYQQVVSDSDLSDRS